MSSARSNDPFRYFKTSLVAATVNVRFRPIAVISAAPHNHRMDRHSINVSALLVALCYAALAFWLLRGVEGGIALALWATSPLVVPLAIALVSRKKSTQLVAFALLICFSGVGAVLLPWGLVWNPGDYNHLVVIFLPLYEFGFLVVALVALGIATVVGRHPR